MSKDCLGCSCSSARTTPESGRLVMATQVDHTATALRSMALRRGMTLQPLAPGLLSLAGTDLDEFVAQARRELSSVEAEEVRCLVTEQGDLSDAALLARAMTAPTLATAGARVANADLLPLFDDEHGSFHAAYQPIVELAGNRTIGYESLLRAVAPDGRPVLPDVLFPAAEQAGWTHLLDRVGRTTALRDAGPWLGDDDLLFINFIPTSIYRPEVCLRTTELAAREAGVRLDQIVFEVTEGHQVRDLGHLERVFDYYRSRECKVALDDLGAGYSSLNLLVRLEPDVVKLDKDLTQSLPGRVGSAVVAAIVDITHAYGGKVLAECVETREQADAARELGVDLGQGWLFGRPERPHQSGAAPSARKAGVPAARTVDPGRPDVAVALAPVVDTAAADTHTHAETDTDTRTDTVAATGHLAAPRGAGLAGLPDLLVRAVDASVGGVVVVDVLAPDSPMLYVNPSFEQMTGYGAQEVVGRNCRLLQGPDTDSAAVRSLAQAIRRGEQHRVVLRNYRKDGSAWWNELHLSPVRDEHSHLTHYLGFQHDVTARVEAEAQLVLQAARDSLTGLSNRVSLVEHLEVVLTRAAREEHAVAVLFLDLDGFKAVNDDLGHSAGDAVLVEVARRASAALRTSDLLARNGGDEFVAVLTGLDPLDAARVADRAGQDVVASLRRPFSVGAEQARLSGSVGIALYPDHATSGEKLLAAADAAMYQAKRSGSDQVASFLPLRSYAPR